MIQLYKWDNLNRAYRRPGLYAWYYSPLIPRPDLDRCYNDVLTYKANADQNTAKKTVERLLSRHVLEPLAPLDYTVELTSELAPTYIGTAQYEPVLADTFLQRLVHCPERLYALRYSLATTDYHVQAPLYIGRSKNIRSRLLSHKHAIQTGRSRAREDLNEADKSFAFEVLRRKLIRTRLSAQVLYTPSSEPQDLEYILNRSTFPAFGRK